MILNCSGQVLNYTNWHSGEPNGGVSESCALMLQDGTWNDGTCSDSQEDTLCEKLLTTTGIFYYLLCLSQLPKKFLMKFFK